MTSPEWHAEARKMRSSGATISAIARACKRSPTAVKCVVDPNYNRQMLDRTRKYKARIREQDRHTRVSEARVDRNEKRIVERSYQEPRAPAPITQPTIKILLTQPEPEAPRLRFAPKSTIRIEAPGVRRWREIHQAMMRRGLIPARPSVIEELHP